MARGQSLQDPFLNTLRKERVPVAVWRYADGLRLIDAGLEQLLH